MEDTESLFHAWLEGLEIDEGFTEDERRIITADLCMYRELMLCRCEDFFGDEYEDGEPEFMLFIRSAPYLIIEADDDVAGLIDWATSVGITVSPHFSATSWAWGRVH